MELLPFSCLAASLLRLFFFLLPVTLYAQERPGGDDVVTAIFFEKLEAGTGLRADLNLIKDNAGLSGDETCSAHLSGEVQDDGFRILGAIKGGFPFFLFDENDVNDVLIVFLGKLPGDESFATLTDTHDHKRHVTGFFFPLP